MKFRLIGGLAVAAALTTSAAAAPPPGVPDGWTEGYVYSNGARMHYYRAVPNPGKPVLVMAHGMTDNGLTWTTLTKDLEAAYDIYMPDARGHGLSDPFPDTVQGGDTHVADLVGFIQAMKFEKPILMGHSMGGATVMRIGAMHPDLARAIIMLDPGLGGAPAAAPARPATTATPAPAATAPATPRPRAPGAMSMSGTPEAMVIQNNDTIENFVAACGRSNPMWDPVDCQYWALSKKQFHGAYSPAQTAAMRGSIPPQEAMAGIKVPALILKADADAAGRENDLKAASVMTAGKLVHVEGSRHNLHHDKRARTVELINGFLSGV